MLENVFREKTVQVSFVSGVLFFLIAHKDVLKMMSDLVKNTLNIRLNGNYLLALHSVLFAVLVGFLTYNVFVPLLGWNAEGQDEAPTDAPAVNLPCNDGFTMDANGVCVPDMGDQAPPTVGESTEGMDCSADPSVCVAPTYCGGQTCLSPP